MKHTFLLLALPLAALATLPLLHTPEAEHPHPHGQEILVHHLVASDMKPMESREQVYHFNAARAELNLATTNMAREAVVNAGANDEDMDLAFNLENGLADLTVNSTGSDADINNDFSLEHELSDLSGNTAAADAEINAQFLAGK
jgi:hypothetical protein